MIFGTLNYWRESDCLGLKCLIMSIIEHLDASTKTLFLSNYAAVFGIFVGGSLRHTFVYRVAFVKEK